MSLFKKKWFSRTLLGFSTTSLLNDFNHEMVTAILPLFIFNTVGKMYAPFAVGLVAGISNCARAIANLFGGWLGQKVQNQKKLLLIGYGLTPIFSCLIGTASSLTLILLYRTIAWGARGIRTPIRDAWLVKILSTKDYGKAFGFLRAMDTFGAILGPLVVYFTLMHAELKTIFLFALFPGILSIIALLVLVPNYQENKINRSQKGFFRTLFMMPKAFKFFLLIRFIFGIGNFDPTLVILRAQEVLTKQTNQTMVATAWVILFYIIFNVIRLISEVSIGFLSDFLAIKKKNLLAILGFGSFALVTLLLLIKTQNLWVWSIIFILSGLSLGAVTVLEKAYAAELLPHDAVSEGYGILHMIIGVTSLLASLIVGGLWNYFSAPWGFGYSAFVSIATIILFYILKPS